MAKDVKMGNPDKQSDAKSTQPTASSAMSHRECVEYATAYMHRHADVVLPEFFTHNAELPDVAGFGMRSSTVIECKVTRADFLKDAKKSFRLNPNSGMGDYRYYCCPKDLIKPEELPYGWGLLYIYPSGVVRTQRHSTFFNKKDINAEYHALFYYARRAYYAGVHDTVLAYRGFN